MVCVKSSLKINPCERNSLDDVLRALTNNMVPYIKSLPISQASVLECLNAEIAAGNTTEVPSNEGTNSCTFLSLKSMIELFKRKKLETIRIQDLLEEIAVETILKYRDQINQYRDISSQYHPYEALEIMKKQDPSLDLFGLKYHLHSRYLVLQSRYLALQSRYLALSEEVMLELYGKLSDIRETTKDQLFLATYVCPPYTVSLGIFRQKFFLLDTQKVSSRSGGVFEGVVITNKDRSNQSVEEMCAWLWKRLDNVNVRAQIKEYCAMRFTFIYEKSL